MDLSAPEEIKGWPTVGDRLKEWLLERVRSGSENMDKHIRSLLPPQPVPPGGDIRASRYTPDEMAGMIPIMAMSEKEVLEKLRSFLTERNPQLPGATQQGIMDVIKAIQSKLIGPKTYEPLDDILMVAHHDPNHRALGEFLPRYEYLRDYKPLTTPSNKLSRAKWEYENGLWPVAQSTYDTERLVPFGLLPQTERSSIVLSNRGRNPVSEAVGRQLRLTPGHEFVHAGHLYGDEDSYVKGLFDKVNKMGPDKVRESAFGLSSEMFPEKEYLNKMMAMYQNRQNPNELIADLGSRSLVDLIRGGK